MKELFKLKIKERSKKKPIREDIQGQEISTKTNKWVNKERFIDRENNKYFEHVETSYGTVLHHCCEKLSDHLGHGSAKNNNNNNNDNKNN